MPCESNASGDVGTTHSDAVALAIRLVALIAALSLTCWSSSAHAYRPFESTDASVVAAGVLEIELGPIAYTDLPNGTVTELPTATMNVGLSSRWEIVIDATRSILRSNDSDDQELAEAAVLVKHVARDGILQKSSGWSVATEFGILLPTRNLDDDYGATMAVIGSGGFDDSMFHLNAAISQNRSGNTELFAGVIVEALPKSILRPVAEISFEYEDETQASSWSALVGAIWRRAESLSFDVALRAIREADDWSYQARIGLTWAFVAART
jgi:hypothetical protein